MSQKALLQVLRQIPFRANPNLLVGTATGDDAGVYRLSRNLALVQTVDFFTPIVDDPFLYGQIAAANALSDVYAMGGRPLTAMNLLGVPADVLPSKVINAILRGGARKVLEADCTMVGGHTIRNPEPVYGLSVTGLVSPARLLTNANARPGDLLVLTKPLGTGIVTTGIKRGQASGRLAKLAIRNMCLLNTVGAIVAEGALVKAATDITGFGLLGHLASLCRASKVGARISASKVPMLSPEVLDLINADCVPGGTRQNLETAGELTRWHHVPNAIQVLLADAQTSGGLMLCVPPRNLRKVLTTLKRCETPVAAVFGEIIHSSQPRIEVYS